MLALSRLRRCCSVALSLAGAIILVCVAGTDPAEGGGAPKKGQYQTYLKHLHTRFQSWDLNSDNALDKAELAKAFRGPDAKPYDALDSQEKDDDPLASPRKKGKVKRSTLAMVTLPRSGLAVNLVLAELLTKPEKAKSGGGVNPAVQQYGDFQFLALLGKNDKIAKQDYDNWCTGYAKNMDQYQLLVKEVKASQDKVNKANKKNRQAALNELNKHQTDLAAVSAQLNAISPAIHAALNAKK